MSDYVIHLGVDVDLAGLKQKINNVKVDPIKVNFNVSDFDSKINEINRALRKVGFGSTADEITKDLDKMNIAVTKATSSLKKNGNIAITVDGVDELNRAVTLVKEYKKVDIAGGKFKLEPMGAWSKFSQSFKTEADEVNNAFNQLKQKQKELASLSSKLVGLDSKKDVSTIKDLTSQYQNLRKEIVELYSNYGNKFSPVQNTELSKSLQDAEDKVRQLKLGMKDDIQFKIDTGDFDKEINDIETKLKQMTNLPEKSKKELQNNVKYLKSLRTQMNNSLKAADKEKDPDKATEKINKAIELRERYDKLLETTNNKVGIAGGINKEETSRIKEEAREVNDAFEKIKKTRQEIGKKEVELIGAKAKGDLNAVKDINDELTRLKSNLSALEADNIGAKFSDEQKSELRELRKQNQYNKKQAQNKVDYKEEAREVNDAYNEIYNTKKRIGNLEVKLISEEDTQKAKNLSKEIDRLKTKLETLEANDVGSKFTKKQKSALDELDKQIEFNKKQAQDTVNAKLELDYDKEKIKDTNDAFNELKKTVTAIGNLEIDLFKAELEDDARAIKDIEDRLDKLRIKRDQIKDDFGGSFTDKQNAALKSLDEDINFKQKIAMDDALNSLDNSTIASVKKDMNELIKLKGQISKMDADIKKLEFVGDGDVNKIANFKKELAELEATYKRLKTNLNKKISDNKDIIPQADIDSFNTALDAKTKEGEKSLARFKAEYADLRAELAQEIKLNFESGEFDDQFDNLKRRFNDLTQYPDKVTKSFNELKAAYRELVNAATPDENGVVDEEKLINAQEKYAEAVKKTNNILKQQERIERDIADANRVASNKESLSLDMQNWLKNNTKAAKKYGDVIKELDHQLDKLQADGKLGQSDVNKARASFNQYAKQATLDGLTGLTWFDELKTKFTQYASYFSVAEVFMQAERALTDMFEQVKAVDTAMTELKKVTNETDAAYDSFLSNAASKAKEIGTTVDGLVTSTADFARLGYSMSDAANLAEVANIYAVVGDDIDSVETATESLISTMTAFGVEASNSMSVVDKFNAVGNNFAISSGGIGEALERSASSMAAANNTLDETIALITAANTVVQDADAVGTAFKTISMRIRGATTELEDAGLDTEGMASSTAKLREEILALSGVDIMLDSTTFKSTYKIMEELAAKWENLTDIQQASITELIAGKRQGNIVSSLMTNFDIAQSALQTSLNSSGSAMEEHEKYMDSMKAKLSQLKAAWQSFSLAFMDTDTLKASVDALRSVVEVLEWLIDNLGVFGTAGLGTGLGIIFKNLRAKEAKKTLGDVVTAVNSVTDAIKGGTAATEADTNANNENTASEKANAQANVENAVAEQAKAQNTAQSTREEIKEIEANTLGNASEQLDAAGSEKSGAKELEEAVNTGISNAEQEKEIGIDIAGNASEQLDAAGSEKSGAKELEEAVNTGISNAEQVKEGMTDVGGTIIEAGKQASKSAGGFKKLWSSMSAGSKVALGVTAAITIASIIYNQYKKAKEAAAEARQEIIEDSNAYLDAASNFEQAYIKYSGKTDLTESEEADLASAIKGTVDALGKKDSALQSAVNSSNDYLASLEAIKDAELEAAKTAAEDKRDNAADSLKEAAIGWESWDGSEVDIAIGSSEARKIAEEVGGDFFKTIGNSAATRRFGKTQSYKLQLSSDADVSEILDYYNVLLDYKEKLQDAELDDTAHFEQVETAIGKMSESIGVYTDGVYEAVKANYQLSEDGGIPKTVEEYIAMREAILNDTQLDDFSLSQKMTVLNDLDSTYGQLFDLSSAEAQARKFVGIIEGYGDGTEDGTNEIGTVETFLNMRTAVNNNECSVGEYLDELNNVTSMAEGFSDEEQEQFNLAFGIDTDSIKKQYDGVYNYIKRNYLDNLDTTGLSPFEASEYVSTEVNRIQDLLKGSSAIELKAFANIKTEIDWENASNDEILKLVKKEADIIEALDFEANIEIDTTALEMLNTVLEESASAMGLTTESIDSLKSRYSSLDSYNPSTLFEKTANGVKVNREELVKLEKEYNNLTKTEVQEHIDNLTEAYNENAAKIDKCSNAAERAQLIAENETYKNQIEELAQYQTQLEGVTGAYQKWIDAQSGPEDYEGYESVATSREDIEDEIDRGFISNKGKAYIDLLSGEDLEGKSIDDYAEAWDRLDDKVTSTGYSINDFFTVNDDGDITATGIDRFMQSVKEEFDDIYDSDTGIYDFSQENLKKIQDEWGIGIEAIELLLEAAVSAGYNVDWGSLLKDIDLDTSSFETLVSAAEAAQTAYNKIDGLEDIDFNFTATGVEEAETEIEKARQTFSKFINEDGTVNIEADGAEEMQFILTTLIVQKQQLSTPAIMKVDTSQIDQAETDVIAVINAAQKLQTAYENYEIAISTGVDVENAKGELNTAIEELQTAGGESGVDIKAKLKLPTNEDLETAKNGIGDIKVGAALDETSIGSIATQIQTECTPKVIAEVTGIDESAITNGDGGRQIKYTPEHSEVDAYVNGLQDVNKKIIFTYTTEGTKPNPSNIERTITYTYETEGTGPAAGTAHAGGTSGRAFARGNWGIKGSGTALGGELGQELVVRDGKFFTIGDSGAEFFHYKPNDIIFNAAQTESLFKYGGIKGAKPRGTMLASGSAFAEGSVPSIGRAFWQATASISNFAKKRLEKVAIDDSKAKAKVTEKEDKKNTSTYKAKVTESDVTKNRNVSSSISKSSSGSSSSKDEKEFEETIDWIETAIDRIERAIDKLDQKANSVYRAWSERNIALADQIGKVGEEIDLQQQAYDRYLQEANGIGLSEEYASKVRDGTIDIEKITDEDLKKKIDEYTEWYNKAITCKDAIEDLKETESELYAQRFENIQTQYDGILQGYEHTKAMLNEYISQAEEQGYIVSKKYYETLIANEKSNIAELKKEQTDLIAARDEAVASGTIVEGSEAWLEQCATIDEVTQAIEEGSTALLEYARVMEEIDWQIFDLMQERISAVSEEADFFIELMSNKDLFDDDGKLTSQGLATMGLHAQNYNTHMYQADEYGAEVAELDKQIASDPYDQELINRRNELLELQRESILAAEDEKNAIRDLVEEGINLELDALQELIDKKNEELESERDLYEYQKKVKEQTEEIASLEKQMAAYQGDDSEEAQQKIQQIKVDLETARQDLQETEYDKLIDDASAMLDTLYNEYELILNTRLDNIDYLLEQVIESINLAASADGNIATALGSEGALAIAVSNNATSIKDTLTSEAKNVGTILSSAMNNIWSVGEGNAKSVLTMYGEDFRTKSTTIITTLNGIKSSVNSMVSSLNKDAQKKTTANKTATSAKKNPTSSSSSKKTTTTTKKSSGDGVPKIGDKVKYVSGKYYNDSQGNDPLGSHNQGKYVYITNINKKDWATHGYHISTGNKLGKGDLGWLKLNQLSGYATGKYNFLDDETAWTQEGRKQEFIVRPSDGAILTPIARGDSVLTSVASKNIWDMANSPAEFIKDNLGIGSTGVPDSSNIQNNYTQHLEKVVFSFPNVKNYEEMLSAMQKDRNFERLINSMTIDQIAGKSSLAKGKSIRH